MSGANQGPSFKTDLHRNKTKKWAEAPSYDYGGDDWGVADEYGEYGSYDDEPQPQSQPGNSYHGQTASVSSARGRDSYASQTPQPPQRIPSYEANDEQRAFSTVTSPVVTQEEMLNTFPPQRFSQQQQQVPTQEARRPSESGSTQHSSPQIQRFHSPVQSFIQHQSPRFDIQHAGPSHEPEYDDRAYPGEDQNQGLGLSTGQDEHDPRHSWLPPLPSEMAANQQHHSGMNQQARLPPFPPRKSSLSSRSRPDLNRLYQAQQPPMPQPSESSAMLPPYGQQQTREEQQDEEEVQQAAPAFIRPADIYKRLAEAKEKERQSMESARNSPERPVVAMSPPSAAVQADTPNDYASPPSSTIGRQSSDSRLSRPFLGSVLPDAPAHPETTREAPIRELSDDHREESAPDHPAQTSTVASIASTVTNALHLPGLSISNPMLARALGISNDDAATPAESEETTATSPTLPSISRFSGFGSLTDGIWQNQSSGTADDGMHDDAAQSSLPSRKLEASEQSQGEESRHVSEREEVPNPSIGPGANQQRSAHTAPSTSSRPVPQAIFAHQHNRSLAADSDSVSSPTAYYFSDQAGSLDDRIHDESAYEGFEQQDKYSEYPRRDNTSGAFPRPLSHATPAQFDSGALSMHDSGAPEVLNVPGPLPQAAAAVSREELEANHARTASDVYEDSDDVQRAHADKDEADEPYLEAPTLSAEWSYDLDGLEASPEVDKPVESIEPIDTKEYMEATTPTGTTRALPDSSQTLTRDEIEQAYATRQSPSNLAGRNDTSDRSFLETPRTTGSHNVEHYNTIFFAEDRQDETSTDTYFPGSDHAYDDPSARRVPEIIDNSQPSSDNSRQPPAPVSSRFLQNPLQIDPIARGTSPGGRVKQMAEKYDVIHTLSRQSTMQSPTGSASGSRSGKESSGRSIKDYDRPHLPGEWISYADTINTATDSDRQEPGYYNEDLRGEDETELDRSPTPTPRHEEESVTTPTRAHVEPAEEPVDFSPTVSKRNDASHPLSALAAAGQALATSLMSSVGMQGNDDENGSDSEAAESALTSENVTPDVTDRAFTGFQSQPSALSRNIRMSSEELPTTRNESMPSQHDQVQHTATPNVVQHQSPSELASLEDAEDASVSDEDELPPPAPLRPRSNISRPTVDTTPQRPIWPSTTSAMSINYSPEDTESDRLRKDVLRSLSPGPDITRKSVDMEPEPRSSAEYPRFGAVPDMTTDRKMASTPLHLSPPPANILGTNVEPINNSTTQSAQPNLLSVHPLSSVNMSRESTVLPREYDSYWAEKESQDDGVTDSPQVPAIGVTQSTVPPISAQNHLKPSIANVPEPIKESEYKPRSASPVRPNYLAKRFSWENVDASEASISDNGASVSQASQNVPLPPSSSLLATNSIVSPITTPRHSHDASAIVEPSQEGLSQISRDVSQSSGPQAHLDESDGVPAQLPGDTEIGDSPAQYKYERPFQRARGPSESEGVAKTGLRKTSSAARPFGLADQTRTISSGHFSAQGAALAGTESSQPGFKTIMAMRDTSDRIATFDKTREDFAAMDTGLDDWLKYMLRQNQELASDLQTLGPRTNTGGFVGSMRHKISPSIAKLTKAPGATASPISPSSRAPSSSAPFGDAAAVPNATRMPSYSQRRTPSMSEASKGKAFLQTAGLNAKGIFAKGRSKFRGVSGEKVEPLPIRRHASPKRDVSVTANSQNLNETGDVPQTKSPTPIWAAFASVKDDQALPTPSNKGDYFTGRPEGETTAAPLDSSNMGQILTQTALASNNDIRMATKSDDTRHAPLDNIVGRNTTSDSRTENTSQSDANVMQQAEPTTTYSGTVHQGRPQQANAFNDDMEDRPISPIQNQAGRPALGLSTSSRLMLNSEDMPISPIVRDVSNHNTRLSGLKLESVYSVVTPPTTPRSILRNSENYKPRPHTIAVSDSVADRLVRSASSDNQIQSASPQLLSPLQPPGRLSLALEKQNSATVTETEIHPALMHRTSSYGGSVSNAGRPEQRHRGSSVGPKPPANIARLPPSVQKRYASYNSTNLDPCTTPARRLTDQHASQTAFSSGSAAPTNISTDAANSVGIDNTPQRPRKRSKSPFARWRERSRSRDARQHAHKDELLSQQYDEQRPAMPSYPPSRISVATSAGLNQRDMSMPNLVTSADSPSSAVVSPSSTKTKSSPFARFRERSRGRSFGRASVAPMAAGTLEAQNGATPTRPGPATRTASGADVDQSLEQIATTESDRRGRSRSFARFRTKSTTNTSDPIDAITTNGDRSRSKRRSWYNQFLCYDEHGIPVDAPLLPGAHTPQPQNARSRSGTDVMRHSSYNVSSTNGLDMPQEPVPRLSDAEYAEQEESLARDQQGTRPRSVSRKRLASMTEAEREARVRSLKDKAMFAMRLPADSGNPDIAKEMKRSSIVFGPEPPSRSASVSSLESARGKFGPEPPPDHPPPLPPTPKQYQQSPSRTQSPPISRPWATPNHQRQNPSFLEHKEQRRQQLMASQHPSPSADHAAGSAPPQMRADNPLTVRGTKEHEERRLPVGSSPSRNVAHSVNLPVRDGQADEISRQTHPDVLPTSPSLISRRVQPPAGNRDVDDELRQIQPGLVSSASSQVLPQVDLPARAPSDDEQQEQRQEREVASSTVPREVNLPGLGQESKQQNLASPTRASLPGLPAHLQHLQLTLSSSPAPVLSNASRAPASLSTPEPCALPRPDVQVNNAGPQHATHRELVQVNNEGPQEPTHRQTVQVNNQGPQNPAHRRIVQINNAGPQDPMHRHIVQVNYDKIQSPTHAQIVHVNNEGPQHSTRHQIPSTESTQSPTPPMQRKRAESIAHQSKDHDRDEVSDMPALPTVHAKSTYPQAHTAQLPTWPAPAQSPDIMRWRDSVAGASDSSSRPASAVAPVAASGRQSRAYASPTRKARESWPFPDTAPAEDGQDAYRMSGPLGQSEARRNEISGGPRGRGRHDMNGLEDENVVLSPTLAGPGWEWMPGMDGEAEGGE